MTESPQPKPTPDATHHSALAASDRLWRYGPNTIILVIAVVAIVGLVDWLSVKYNYTRDCTTGGIYSLSPRTKSLLKEVDKSGRKYQIVSLYPGDASADQTEYEQGRKVQQLIHEYTRASSHIKQFKPRSHAALLRALRSRFGNSFAPYKKVVDEFPALAGQLNAFFKAQGASIKPLETNPAAAKSQGQAQSFAQLDDFIRHDMGRTLRHLNKSVKQATASTLPDWPGLTTAMVHTLGRAKQNILFITDKANYSQYGPAVQAWLKIHAPEFKGPLAQITAYMGTLQALKPVKSGQVLADLSADSIVLMGQHSIKVLHRGHIFVPEGGSLGGKPQYLFKGEQAINAALLAMSHKQKTKVVFVSIDPDTLITGQGPFSGIAQALRQNNFKVYEWSPMPANPQMQQPPAPPPAIGKGVIWVVIDLPPAGQQGMMAGMAYAALQGQIKQQLAQGGNALFLLGNMPQQLLMATQGQIPFKPLLAGYGVRLRSTYMIVQRTQVGRHRWLGLPRFSISSYPKSVITDPIQSLTSHFEGILPQGDLFLMAPTWVGLLHHLPAGVSARVILQSPARASIWATSASGLPAGTFNPSSDIKSPIPMGVMAQKANSRIVVIDSPLLVQNAILQAGGLSLAGGQPTFVAAYPGNQQLFMNSIYWLAHQSHLIAVSPRATVALRIGEMTPTEETTSRLFSFLGPAFLAIVAGFSVYLVRRRV